MAYPVCISISINTPHPTKGEAKHVVFYGKDESAYRFNYKKLENTLFLEYLKRKKLPFDKLLMTVTFKTSMAEADNIEFCKSILKRGIFCENDYYHFLGHSDSQLREKTCYLMNASEEGIRYHLANFCDFVEIKDPGLRAKKIGLLFSSFQQSLELKEDNCKVNPDTIKKGIFKRHIFTNGCGFMSQQFVSKIGRQLAGIRYPEPSAVFVRYQGFEGMLVLKQGRTNVPFVEECRNEPENTNKPVFGEECENNPPPVQFHESMQKFVISDQTMRQSLSFLCIVDHSRPHTNGYLDAKLVMLLAARGVSAEYLESLQRDYYSLLERMCHDRASANYFLRLKGRLSPEDSRNDNLVALRRDEIKEMIDDVNVVGRGLSGRQVARIRILVPTARVVFGVCDPYNKLEDGECHFSPALLYPEEENFGARDKVVVARSPCYYPGDIRVLNLARDKPEYEHLKDCLVLPTKGRRPHAFECAGGDLGGSKFFVSWDTKLIPKENIKPCSYLPTIDEIIYDNWHKFRSFVHSKLYRRPRKSTGERREEMVEYFAGFTDELPNQIDKTYMKLARGPGLSLRQCKDLSRMFYQAVNSTVNKDVLQKKLSDFEPRGPSRSTPSADETSHLLKNRGEGDEEMGVEVRKNPDGSQDPLLEDRGEEDEETGVEVRTNPDGLSGRFLGQISCLTSKDPVVYLSAEVLQEFEEQASRFLEEAKQNHYIE